MATVRSITKKPFEFDQVITLEEITRGGKATKGKRTKSESCNTRQVPGLEGQNRFYTMLSYMRKTTQPAIKAQTHLHMGTNRHGRDKSSSDRT